MFHASRLPDDVVALGRTQRGLLTTAQLRAAGCSHDAVRTLVAVGALVRLERNVFTLVGAVGGYAHDCTRAVLAIGDPVAVSHGSGARLCGFAELGEGVIEVTLPPGRRTRRTCALVHTRPLPQGDVMTWRKLPVTAPPRTLADLVLERYDSKFLGRLVDHLFVAHLLTPRSLALGIEGLGWHPGITALRRLAEVHLEGMRVTGRIPDSVREAELTRLLLAAGLPAPVRQQGLEIDGRLVSIDLAIPQFMVAIEFDSFEVHSGRGRFDDDRRRVDDLTALGWRVVQVTSAMSDAEVVRRIARAIQQQRVALGAA